MLVPVIGLFAAFWFVGSPDAGSETVAGVHLPRAARSKAIEPVAPPLEPGIAAHRAAERDGSPRPGEAAFRANADAFVDTNRELAEAKAAAEGITVDELRELTFLGLLAMRLRQWDAVERQLGRPVPPEVRDGADALVFGASDATKATIRAEVARGASESERREVIRSNEDRFVADYLALTGLDAAGYDALLGEDYDLEASASERAR